MSTHEDEPDTTPNRRRLPRWAWWHRQTTLTRRLIRTTLALLVTLLVSAGVGVLTASADSSLGPHRAQYDITVQHEIVLDLGPLGAVLIDSPLPWPLGVDVVVSEIPRQLTGVPADPVTGLAGDVAAYAHLASQPEAAVAEATTLLVRDAVGRTVLVWSVLLLLIAGGRLASLGLLRREVTRAARRPGVLPVAGALAVTLASVPVATVVGDPPPSGTTISALAGTPLEELRMTGRMAGLLNTYGGYVVDAIEENDEFYGNVRENLEAAYALDRAPLRPPSIPIVSPTPQDPVADPDEAAGAPVPPDGEGTGPDGEVTGPDDAATDEGPLPRREPVTLVMATDLHCNVGMGSVIADTVRLSGASALLDGGDTVMSGTSVESYCVNAFAGEMPEDLPIVVSTGNHDSQTTAEQMAEAGYTVLEGEPVEVAGVRVLGATDPTITALGEGTRPEREETVPELGTRLADRACEAGDDPVDILLVHNPLAAEETLTRGCAPLALSGHWHRQVGPEPAGEGVQYVSASSGGASGGLTVGPLNGTAYLTVLRYDIGRNQPMDYRIITIEPDATVELGRWYRFPSPDAVPDQRAADAPPATPGDPPEVGPGSE